VRRFLRANVTPSIGLCSCSASSRSAARRPPPVPVEPIDSLLFQVSRPSHRGRRRRCWQSCLPIPSSRDGQCFLPYPPPSPARLQLQSMPVAAARMSSFVFGRSSSVAGQGSPRLIYPREIAWDEKARLHGLQCLICTAVVESDCYGI